MRKAKRLKRDYEKEGLLNFKNKSQYGIVNALTNKYLTLSDNHHEPYCMMPPASLHSSGSDLIKYMFESLHMQISSGKDCDDIDKQHIQILMIIKRQSEQDFSRGAMRNGLIDGTKCQSEERKGNFFLLLCIANRTEGSRKFQKALGYETTKWNKWFDFL